MALEAQHSQNHCFYLYFSNKEADYDLDIHVDDKTLPHSKYPVYLGVKLQQHTKVLRCKVTARTSLIRCLASTSWGTSGSTLRTGAMTIVLSAAEYDCPVWCHSFHAQKLDMSLNETLRIVSGCPHAIPMHYLPVICGIAPFNLCREAATWALIAEVRASPDHLLHNCISIMVDSGNQLLKFQHPFQRHAQSLFTNPQIISNGVHHCHSSTGSSQHCILAYHLE